MAVRESSDLFFGGLPPIASFAEVEKTISDVGDEVLRFQFRQECGYGVIRFSNAEAATKACHSLNEVCHNVKYRSLLVVTLCQVVCRIACFCSSLVAKYGTNGSNIPAWRETAQCAQCR